MVSCFQSGGTMRQNQLILVVCIYLFAASVAFATEGFPIAPDIALTPGALCETPDEIRYPEKINYCNRGVSTGKKWAVISRYTKKLQFTVTDENRTEFKIDHYIPLCMGGANTVENLWPQHSSIYRTTDSLEVLLCAAMAAGKLSQSSAIEKLKMGKSDLSAVPGIIREINLLIGN